MRYVGGVEASTAGTFVTSYPLASTIIILVFGFFIFQIGSSKVSLLLQYSYVMMYQIVRPYFRLLPNGTMRIDRERVDLSLIET